MATRTTQTAPKTGLPRHETAHSARKLFAVSVAAYLGLDAAAFVAVLAARLGLWTSPAWLGWAQVHLLTIGVIVQMAFALALRAVRRPAPHGADFAVWGLVNLALVLLVLGMSAGNPGLATIAALLAMAAVLWVLTNVLSSGLESEPGAIARRFYATGLGFLIVGIALALQMLRGWPAPGGFPGLLEAHIHANVWGFLGLVSGGACLSLTRRSTGARLPHQALANRCFWFLTAGSGALVVGAWLGLLPLTMLGMLLYVIGTVMMLLTLIAFDRHLHWSSPVLGHVTAAYVWILVPAVVAPVVVMTTGQLPAGGVETAALGAILTGWVLQLGLAAFSGVPLAGRAQGEVGSWLGVALFNLGVLILWISARASNATAPIAVGYALILAVWIARLRAGILTMRHRGAPWL